MPNGGSLSDAWERFDPDTRIGLAITELDRLYARLDSTSRQSTAECSDLRREFTERISALRTDMVDGFDKIEKRQSRSTGLLYTMIGGIVVGLVLLVVQLAPH